jgi:hypothetical protein
MVKRKQSESPHKVHLLPQKKKVRYEMYVEIPYRRKETLQYVLSIVPLVLLSLNFILKMFQSYIRGSQ